MDKGSLGWHAVAEMPKTPRFPPSRPRAVEILAYQAVQLLDVAGPLQVFASANELTARPGAPPLYAPRVVSAGAPVVTASAGLGLVGRAAAGRAGGARYAPRRWRPWRPCGGRRSGTSQMGAGAGEAGAAGRVGLHRRVPARGGGTARRAARGDALEALRRARPALSRHPRGARPDLRARRRDLEFGRRDSRDRPGAGARRRGCGAHGGARRGAPPRHVPEAARRAGAVQHRARRCKARRIASVRSTAGWPRA